MAKGAAIVAQNERMKEISLLGYMLQSIMAGLEVRTGHVGGIKMTDGWMAGMSLVF